MNDTEIIKALECCFVNKNCNGCPQIGKGDCLGTACTNALYLINRQREEIERLEIELKAMRGTANSLKMHHDLAVAEREANVNGFTETLERQRAEIERLTSINDELCCDISDIAHINSEEYEKIRAEAVKEFAERMKKECFLPIGTFVFENIITERMIDRIAKEMVGEQG